MLEMIWRLLFLVVYVIFFLIRYPYGSKQIYNDEPNKYMENLNLAMKREGQINMIGRSVLSFVMLLSIIVYVIYPPWLLIFALPIPVWLRLTSLGVAIMTLPLLYWAHRTLVRQYSPHLELQEEHKLITSGPYEVVRHPMYTILIVFMLSISFFAANSLILIPHLMAIFLILLRLNKEEAMLIGEFGDAYREYIINTGRLLPKFK